MGKCNEMKKYSELILGNLDIGYSNNLLCLGYVDDVID